MALSFVRQASLLALFATSTFAQTFTDCDPTKKTCPPNAGLDKSTYTVDFTKGPDNAAWKVAAGNIKYTANGAEFTLAKKGDAPTIETSWYYFFGRAEVLMKAAPGTGVVSSVVIESDDLDEVDWEWIGGKDAEVQTNYFGKGNTTSFDRGKFHTIAATQSESHNYTIDWTPKAITWYINNNVVRTLNYADAVGGKNFPQTPARLRLGIWAGGDPDNSPGTIEWAGGPTDYAKGPYTMSVQKVTITNTNPAKAYSYGDLSGDFKSIKLESVSPNTDDGTKSNQNGTSPSVPAGAPVASGSAKKNATTTGTTPVSSSPASATQPGGAAGTSAPAGASGAAGKLLSGSAVGTGLFGIALVAMAGLF